jgi:DNA (cytosine-5)-methyltransferase 1
MRHGSLFSGIGGFDLAAEWMGWANVFHCEWNAFGQRILKHYWPDAISYHDIVQTDFSVHRASIDIISGGFPCQPYSTAGKRFGKKDDRHLWPEMLRAIREIQPTWVVGENVLGLVNWNDGLVFHEVQTDLEAEGYEVQPYVLPAVSVDAPHRRDRVWFVAYSRALRLQQCKTSRTMGKGQEKICREGDQFALQLTATGQVGDAADANFQRGEECYIPEITGEPIISHRTYHANRNGWQNFPTQSPICGGDDGIPTELDGITFSKWRNESIKGYGNAVVPQVVYQIFKTIQSFNQ